MGADVCGVTALVKSATRLDSAGFPGDFPLDVMLHPATVRGQEGLAAMRAVVRAYHAGGGIAIHFNIMDADVLLDAQQHPDKYRGLQVRVCGWNVHFTDMCKKEQDAFICRARSIAP
jgi:formate C-acetyltransferase